MESDIIDPVEKVDLYPNIPSIIGHSEGLVKQYSPSATSVSATVIPISAFVTLIS